MREARFLVVAGGHLVCKPAERDRENGLDDEGVPEGAGFSFYAALYSVSFGDCLPSCCVRRRRSLPAQCNLETSEPKLADS